MGEKILGILRAKRLVFSIPPSVHEFLLLSQDRVVVVRQSAKLPLYASTTHTDVGDILAELIKTVKIEEILKSDKHNFAILNSEIAKVELKKRWSGPHWWIDLNIITGEKKYHWSDLNIPRKEDIEFKRWITIRDYENILRPIFGEKLSVKSEISMYLPPDVPF